MANKQLKIWKEDFLRYYSKTSLLTRIIMGALVSYGIFYVSSHYFLTPAKKEIKVLQEKLEKISVTGDVDILIKDLKNRQKKAEKFLQTLCEQNNELTQQYGSLSIGDVGKTLVDFRLLIDSNELKIISEECILPVVVKKKKKSAKKTEPVSTRITLELPESMASEGYQFKVLGTYANIQAFLSEIYDAKIVCFLNNLSIVQSITPIVDKDFRQHKALECSFELHIPYRKGGEK